MIRMLHRLSRDERGAVMVMTAVTFVALLLFAGLALDFGRAHLLRAQLQTAVDAASLAGALQVIPMVELEVSRSERSSCYIPETKQWEPCWESASPVSISGPAWDLIGQRRWRELLGDDCTSPYRCGSAQVVRQWSILPDATEPAARITFAQNARWPAGPLAARVDRLTIEIERVPPENGRPQTDRVRATATMTMPTTFLRLAGIPQLQFTRSGQAQPVQR